LNYELVVCAERTGLWFADAAISSGKTLNEPKTGFINQGCERSEHHNSKLKIQNS
jgi:hypothetical protein